MVRIGRSHPPTLTSAGDPPSTHRKGRPSPLPHSRIASVGPWLPPAATGLVLLISILGLLCLRLGIFDDSAVVDVGARMFPRRREASVPRLLHALRSSGLRRARPGAQRRAQLRCRPAPGPGRDAGGAGRQLASTCGDRTDRAGKLRRPASPSRSPRHRARLVRGAWICRRTLLSLVGRETGSRAAASPRSSAA